MNKHFMKDYVPGVLARRDSTFFSNEPILPSSSILKLPNVVLSLHISAGTWDTLEEKMASALRNIAAFFNGQGVQNEVDLNG